MAAEKGTVSETKPPRPKPSHPTYMEMAKDAIVSLDDKKGATVPAITSFIAGKYTLDNETVRIHLKPALAKGIESATFVRPKNSDAKGFTGRFKVNKVKVQEEAKALKLKEKVKKAKEKAAEKKVVAKVTKDGVKKKTSKPKPKPTKKATPSKKKSPKKSVEKKPKAAKATLKTPKKTAKSLKSVRKSTGSSKKK